MHLSNSLAHIKLTDEKWTITDVFVAGDIPKGEDLSEVPQEHVLPLPGSGAWNNIYAHCLPFSFLQFSAQNCFEVLSLWTDNL